MAGRERVQRMQAEIEPVGLPAWADGRDDAEEHQRALPRNVRAAMAEARVSAKATRPPKAGGATFDFIDLFAGIGGFHHGMSRIGGRCVFTSEWDRYAAATYWAWTGVENIETRDIRTVSAKEIPSHRVLCAGFPCQPFSLAGVSKKNSLDRPHGFDDERQGNLFFSIIEIAEVKKTPILFLENVKNIKSHDQGRTFARILAELGSSYHVRHQVIDASGWVPQHRERTFIVCFRKSVFTEAAAEAFEFPRSTGRTPTLGTILEDKVDDRYTLSPRLWEYLVEYKERHRAKGNGFGYGLFGPPDVARTLSARYHKDGSEILIRGDNGKRPRKLTPREAALLMGFDELYARHAGFDDGFPQVVSDTQSWRQFGNSVSPPVVEAIGRRILEVEPRRRHPSRRRAVGGPPGIA